MIKACQICGDIKPLAEFSKDRAKKDGHSNRCKACDWKKNEKWRQENPEKHRLKNEKWRKNNKDQNRVHHAIAFANRRAKEYGIHGKLSVSDWEEVLETHGYQCLVCGSEIDITIDHIKSLSQGVAIPKIISSRSVVSITVRSLSIRSITILLLL